jgi:type I restriction enzyme S subunit
LEAQQAYGERVIALQQLRQSHRKSLEELDALFATLQHRAFRGELWKQPSEALQA